jgi:hypothetical protein
MNDDKTIVLPHPASGVTITIKDENGSFGDAPFTVKSYDGPILVGTLDVIAPEHIAKVTYAEVPETTCSLAALKERAENMMIEAMMKGAPINKKLYK